MTHTPLDPAGMAEMGTPNYTHAMVTEGVRKWLHIAGQVGVLPDGTTASGTLAQCRQAFANIGMLLDGAGMTKDDAIWYDYLELIPQDEYQDQELAAKLPLVKL